MYNLHIERQEQNLCAVRDACKPLLWNAVFTQFCSWKMGSVFMTFDSTLVPRFRRFIWGTPDTCETLVGNLTHSYILHFVKIFSLILSFNRTLAVWFHYIRASRVIFDSIWLIGPIFLMPLKHTWMNTFSLWYQQNLTLHLIKRSNEINQIICSTTHKHFLWSSSTHQSTINLFLFFFVQYTYMHNPASYHAN